MEKFFAAMTLLLIAGCSTSPPKAPEGLERFETYEKAMRMKEWKPGTTVTPAQGAKTTAPGKPAIVTPRTQKKKIGKSGKQPDVNGPSNETVATPAVFVARRPEQDPFRPGEATVLNISFKGLGAGDLTLGVGNFVEVNDRRAYDLNLHLRSNKIFSLLHYINDRAQILFDYESLLPLASSYHGEQKKRLTEVRTIFHWSTYRVDEWVKRVIEGEGLKQEERHWDMKPLSQNLLSGIFFLRTMHLSPGQKIHFPATQKGENFVFEAEVLRKEKLDTNAGKFDTIVVRIVTRLEELLKTTGDTILWMTDDDRKFPVRLETQIKEGTLKAEAKNINPGT